MRTVCGCAVGWSDHSVSPGVLYRAINTWGASAVEFHLDLEGEGEEFATGHCWLPADIQAVIDTIKVGLTADGDGDKQPAPSELADRDWRADPQDGLRPYTHVRANWSPD